MDGGMGMGMGMSMGSGEMPMPQGPPMTCLKMKGLPFSVTREDILNFFQGCNLLEDSVKIGKMPDGRLTGEAACLFASSNDCSQAQARLDQKHIGSRWVKLIRVVMDEYTNFELEQNDKYGNNDSSYGGSYGGGRRGGGRGGDRGFGDSDFGGRGGRGERRGRGGRGTRGRGGYDDGGEQGDRFGGAQGGNGNGTVRLSDFVNAENRYRAIKMRGLPFSVSVREIRDFFEDFRVAERDITIDMSMGRPTGYALVFFENDSEASRAKD